MNQEALNAARTAINNNFGNLSGLSEELQNTIANIYYKAAVIAQNPSQSVLADGVDGISKGIKDTIFYTESAESLPGMINAFREDVIPKGNESDIDFMTEVFLCMFKYRIENVSSKPFFFVKILKFFSRGKVDEISDLYKQL